MADSLTLVASALSRALPWLGRLATVAMIVLIAWLGARIFWSLATPPTPEPAIAVDTDPARVAQAVAARHLFGKAPEAGPKTAGSAGAADAKLYGVVSPSGNGRGGIAIVSVQGKPAVVFREGEEIAAGVILHRVLARSVEINQGGIIQVLTLPQRGKT